MELTVDELLKGKGTKIKDKEYFPTKSYVEPFLDRLSDVTDNFIVKAKLPGQVSITNDGETNFDDIVYNRVWIQAVLPDEYAWDNHQRVISMLYALDTRKPIVKFYSGALNMACLNLCVFNPDCLRVAELNPTEAVDYSPIKTLMDGTDTIKVTLDKLANTTFTQENIYDNLGHWVDNCIKHTANFGFGKVKLAEDAPVTVYKDLFYNEKSPYYVQPGADVDGFTVYNAFTQLITDDSRDIINKFEKTYLLKNILGL